MSDNGKIKVVILAAGKGVRMQSDVPKAFLKVRGKSMLAHLHDSSKAATGSPPLTVIAGHMVELFQKHFGKAPYKIQDKQLGTAHAVRVAKEEIAGMDHIIVLYADQPYVKSATIKALIKKHLETNADETIGTVTVPNYEHWYKNFFSWGRVMREGDKIIGIREYKDLLEEEKKIKEVNAGVCIFKAGWLWENIEKIKNDNVQKELYLVDLVKIASAEGARLETLPMDPHEVIGANSKDELEVLETIEI
jgi:bifunctional UDP-N-acetylglucosamine pyrophosphorylase/glucosamine-1-phosphate N-acetyltransferase